MELHAFYRQRLMAQPHDFVERAVRAFRPRRDFEAVRKRRALDHQRVVAGRLERIGKTGEYTNAAMATGTVTYTVYSDSFARITLPPNACPIA